ncbi:MAG TPA: glycosyl hydrolase family 18 protein, partial [Candidatus Kapabacteria bacterium]|nr:glycosyl hydrolase family 18 protein [Candidatus Kapabacteria bacterium]
MRSLLLALLLLASNASAQSIHQSEYEKQQRTFETSSAAPHTQRPQRLVSNEYPLHSYGFHPYWAADSLADSYRWDLLNTLAYFGAEIDPLTGEILATNRYYSTAVIPTALANGVAVHLTAILFSKHDSLLLYPSRRVKAIIELLGMVNDRGIDGINIDFEAVPGRLRDSLTAFVRELRAAGGPSIEIVIDIPAVDWNNAFDVASIGPLVDRFFLMAYDYHWRTGPTAGPVAPLNSAGLSIMNSLSRYDLKGIDRSKLILGLPWYGYDWPTASTEKEATTLAGGTAVTTAYAMQQSAIYGRRYDQQAQSPSYTYQFDQTIHQVWYDDAVSLAAKYKFALDEDLAGIGYWAMSYAAHIPEMWDAVGSALRSSSGIVRASDPMLNIPVTASNVACFDLLGR